MKFNYIKIKKILFFISFIYLTLLIPSLITIYSSTWYNFNYEKQQISKNLNLSIRENATNNLIGFFSYQNNLNELWNTKEKKHMIDVREIYSKLIFFGLICILFFIILFDKKLLFEYSKINLVIISSLFILIPFFTIIFSGVFHLVLFDNNFWIINQNDISYYLFPIEFFKNSFSFILIFSMFENMILYLVSKLKITHKQSL